MDVSALTMPESAEICITTSQSTSEIIAAVGSVASAVCAIVRTARIAAAFAKSLMTPPYEKGAHNTPQIGCKLS